MHTYSTRFSQCNLRQRGKEIVSREISNQWSPPLNLYLNRAGHIKN